ncbi:hypothetical protein OG234_13100 [Streptomyces sp. NBC_01420]|uniref:hypothetical protein n=1 Tax=Streptomyces sp. NBC_01420 TaxID=2903858 RepID=UPI00324E5958
MTVPVPDLPGWPWPWPWPDGESPLEPVLYYLRYADGHLGQITVTGLEPVVPEGATLLTQLQYEEAVGEMRDAHAARLAEALSAEEAQRRAAYEALTAVPGIPEDVARSLSGYGGAA